MKYLHFCAIIFSVLLRFNVLYVLYALYAASFYEKGKIYMDRYSRHISLPEIGGEGQLRLSSAKAVVVGAGGLGSPVLYFLASAGIGHIKIIDSDVVDITNLNRQIIHFEDDVGRNKSQSAKEKLNQYNRNIQVCAANVMLNDENAMEHLPGNDIVMSCVDNIKTRYLLNNACVRSGIPFIDGGTQGFEGYILTVVPGITPCYQCIFPILPQKEQVRQTGGIGVLGAAAGTLGSMMALEAIKYIIGIPITSYLHYVDLLSFRITPVTAARDANCPACVSAGGV